MRIQYALLAAISLLAGAHCATAAAIVNGSFEDTTGMDKQGGGNFYNGVPVGWTWSGDFIQLLDGSGEDDPAGVDGQLYLEIFMAPDFGTLSQTVTGLEVGARYEVSFLWGNRGITTPGFDAYDFTVEMGGSTFSRSGSGLVDLSPATITFVAAASEVDLNVTFNDTGTDTATGGALDNFAIRSVAVGGALTGTNPLFTWFRCINETTGQQVSGLLPLDAAWSCEDAGLVVNPGDSVRQIVVGRGVAP